MPELELRSDAFEDHAPIPAEHSHAAGDVPPPLEWSNAPEEAAELVLLCEDPDAPVGTFAHWRPAGIPPRTRGLRAGESPAEAVQGRNDYGRTGYGGPHPPVGDEPHRCLFRPVAPSEPSGLRPGLTADECRKAIEGKAIGTGTLVGTFGR
ncbi:YbhB/YbcL family Raf kinase inhibitor-like protein [Thermomonospora catenispora]|uniref:YbhB/YbcL family Raf kinase inhibitor-like protein n=1 Tax=Thermomonospora catenispora TaxID=2493090 RepID=UPI0011232E14|nr:YbhB/YbcL family Raf kinase inhibitor-like protein [Thermomonospora catenispora]TNY35790.1 YbhB/YbcL family Raf kinase inhibitor-like protein [Thermomonospora catenispora]